MIKVIEILNMETNMNTNTKRGIWEEIWASRPDIISKVGIRREYHGPDNDIPSLHVDFVEMYIQYLAEENDWILRKLHWELDSNETKIIPVAGDISQAQKTFAHEWKKWVNNEAVRESAINYILDAAKKLQFDELEDAVRFAVKKTAKVRIMNAWMEVEKRFAARNALAYRPEHTTTWTGVLAMPIKIAKAINIDNFPRWKPPIPQPQYKQEGVLIASGKIPGYIAYKSEKEVGA